MASLWEIFEPSNLKYNTALGVTLADSGHGPPTERFSWVRTGNYSSDWPVAGWANCNVWSSDDGAHSGTVANLVSDWTSGAQDVGVWNTEVMTCDNSRSVRVWCVQDDSIFRNGAKLAILL